MRSSLATLSALLVAAGTLTLAQERQVGGVGLTMFADSNFRGEALTFRNDVPNLATVNLFKLASSLRVADGLALLLGLTARLRGTGSSRHVGGSRSARRADPAR